MRKKTAQQLAWDFLGTIGVPEKKRPDGIRWCRRARRFMASREEMTEFLKWMAGQMKPPWTPGQRFNLDSDLGVESLKWQLAVFRGEKKRDPAAPRRLGDLFRELAGGAK